MAISAASTFPPALKRAKLTVEEIHLCTGISMDLLEGYEQRRFKPGPREGKTLDNFSQHVPELRTPLMVSMYMDRARFRLLRTVVPRAEINRLLGTSSYEDYRRGLLELCETHAEQLEKAILAAARKRGYVPPADDSE
jgi:hypothetical protein